MTQRRVLPHVQRARFEGHKADRAQPFVIRPAQGDPRGWKDRRDFPVRVGPGGGYGPTPTWSKQPPSEFPCQKAEQRNHLRASTIPTNVCVHRGATWRSKEAVRELEAASFKPAPLLRLAQNREVTPPSWPARGALVRTKIRPGEHASRATSRHHTTNRSPSQRSVATAGCGVTPEGPCAQSPHQGADDPASKVASTLAPKHAEHGSWLEIGRPGFGGA